MQAGSAGRLLLVAAAFAPGGGIAFAQPVPDYDFQWSTIGAPGNPAYVNAQPEAWLVDGRGSVGYEYRMSRLEVSTAQWMEFLNSFNEVNVSSLPSTVQSFVFGSGLGWGATTDTTDPTFPLRFKLHPLYENAGMLPVRGITWEQAAIYCNWLQNGKAVTVDAIRNGAYNADTFVWNDQTNSQMHQLTRSPGARFWIPSLDEWIKAVHFDPEKAGPGLPGWWLHATSSDSAPIPGLPGVGQTSAGVADAVAGTIPLGSYPNVQSPWGLWDTSGASAEWTEEAFEFPNPRYRLVFGSWGGINTSDGRIFDADAMFPAGADESGLRIASAIPAPGCLTIVAVVAFLNSTRRRNQEC